LLFTGRYQHYPSTIYTEVYVRSGNLLLRGWGTNDIEHKVKLHKGFRIAGFTYVGGLVTPLPPPQALYPSPEIEERTPADHHVGFCIKNGKVEKPVWKKDAFPKPLQFTKVSGTCRLLGLPNEFQDNIYKRIFTTASKGIHIREENAQLRIAECDRVPYASQSNGHSHKYVNSSNLRKLPKSHNQLQYTTKAFLERTRGLELLYNHLKVSGWTVDTFRRLDQVTPTPPWFWQGPQ
jgi:hypothetical protein